MKINKSQLAYLAKKFGSDQRIALELGMSRQTVYNYRKKFAIVLPSKNKSGRNQIILEKFSHGVKATALAAEYQLSLPQIYRILRSPSFKTAAQFPQQKLLTPDRYQALKEMAQPDSIQELEVSTASFAPLFITNAIENKKGILLIKVTGSPALVTEYLALLHLVKGIDFLVNGADTEIKNR